ncbi:MAG: hypothetical protein Q8907_04105 [Bacteroidota bacterium]|nr:hypothetical protein [Bacteroidota bacterium]
MFPLNRDLNQLVERECDLNKKNIFSSFKPYDLRNIPVNTDSLLSANRDKEHHSWLVRKFGYEHLIHVDSDDLQLTIDPLFNFEVGQDQNNHGSYYVNTRGIMVQGRIGEKLWFYSDYYENQAVFPGYLTAYVRQNKVIPGQGQARGYGSKGFDYSQATGYLSYSPSRHFNFQFGQGKNFIGDGYRSLLLSDNAYSYPYFKVTTTIWKLQYTNLYTTFLNLDEPHTYQSGYRRKYGAFHYLSLNVFKNLQFSLFESVIWQKQDSTGTRGFDVSYLNPVIFYHSVQFSLGSPDNSVIGANLKWIPSRRTQLYGQFVLDDMDISKAKKGSGYILSKYGFQGGFKYFDCLGLKNLYFQTEYNQVRPYVFSHRVPAQNYSHYNQVLTDPMGANFRESISFLNYRFKNLGLSTQFNYTTYGADTVKSNWGQDIFKSENTASRGKDSYGNTVGQGVKTTLKYINLELSYLMNPKTNMNLCIGYRRRDLSSKFSSSLTNYVYVAFRTSLINKYYDF